MSPAEGRPPCPAPAAAATEPRRLRSGAGPADKGHDPGLLRETRPVSCRGDARHEPFFRRTRFLRQHEGLRLPTTPR